MIRLAVVVLLLPGAAAASDFDLLYSHRLEIAADGHPSVTVRIDDGEETIVVVPKAPLPLGQRTLEGPLTARVAGGRPGTVRHAVLVETVPFVDKEGARAALALWTGRGLPARLTTVGSVYGIRGHVLDLRRYQILVDAGDDAQAQAERLGARFGVRAEVEDALSTPPGGTVELRDAAGTLLASARGALRLDTGATGAVVKAVEHDEGYAAHGREDRLYRGTLYLVVGPDGKLAAVNAVPLEELLRGVVPSEMYGAAPAEALRAQAIAARGEILAQIGTRHLSDPFLLCGEQHCEVYRGAEGEQPPTDDAVASTAGQVLFSGTGIVRTVFSSTCGGHTEDNDAVWGEPADPALRGVADWEDHPASLSSFQGKVEDVKAFLAADVPAMCRLSSFSRADKYRWERRFSAEELDRALSPLGLGPIRDLSVTARGVSGRATALAVTGERGATVVRGELSIRRLLRNLNSSLFVVVREGSPGGPASGWLFRGGGWGHGVGMCQMGAIARAEKGQGHEAILGAYFRKTHVVKLYEAPEAAR